MNQKNKIKILIQCIRPPTVHSLTNKRILNIINEISKTKKVEVSWLVFQPEKNILENFEEDKIINFLEYSDAINAIKDLDPDIIFNEGELSCSSITIAIAAEFLKIPLTTFHLETKHIEKRKTIGMMIKSKVRLLFSNKVFADVSESAEKSKRFKMLRFTLKEYRFLIRTLKNMNYTNFQILKFMTFYPRIQILSNSISPTNKILQGELNLCATDETIKRLEKEGFEKSTIKLVGDPYYEIFDNINIKKNTTSKNQKILFCTSPMHEHGLWTKKEENKTITEIIEKIRLKTGYEIAVKIHPSTSNIKEYRDLLGEQIVIYQQEDMSELLEKYDLMLIYGGSTVMHYAVFSRMPIVFIDFYKKYSNLNWYFDDLVGTYCKNISELLTKISESISREIPEKNYVEYEKKYLGIIKNSSKIASEKILDLIK